MKSCFERNVQVILVQEKDISKGGCEFETFFAKAPEELLQPPISLFDEIAIPLYNEEHYRVVSIRQILLKMGGVEVETRRRSFLKGSNRSSNTGSIFSSLFGRSLSNGSIFERSSKSLSNS